MGSPLSIFGGPCVQASLYDATNGLLHMSLLGEEVMYEETPMNLPLSDGNTFELHKMASFELPFLETDGVLTDLAARRSIRQEVWLIGLENAVKIDDCLISVQLNRSFKPGGGDETHRFTIKGQHADNNDFKSYINLLGTYGNCNVDTNTDDVADGFTNSGCTGLAVDPSFLSGRGNAQEFTLGSGDSFYIDVRCPLDQKQVKITISAYVKEDAAGTPTYNFGLKTVNSADAVVDTEEEAGLALTSGQERRDSKEIIFTPGADVQTLRLYWSYATACSLRVDDVQMEFGELSDYSEAG